MNTWYFEKNEEIPILVSKEGIKNNYPFILIELVKCKDDSINIKVRYADSDLTLIKLKYSELQCIIKKPILVVNAYFSDITNNFNDIQKYIYNFYSYQFDLKK